MALGRSARILLRRSCGAISDVPLRLANEVCAKTRAGVCESPLKFHSAVWLPTIRYPSSRHDPPSTAARSVHPASTHVPATHRSREHVPRSTPREPWAGTVGGACPTNAHPNVLVGVPDPFPCSATYYHHLSVSQPLSCPTRMLRVVRQCTTAPMVFLFLSLSLRVRYRISISLFFVSITTSNEVSTHRNYDVDLGFRL